MQPDHATQYVNSDKIVVLYYRRYASGNFLANILCHNRNFVPKFVFDIELDRYRPNILDLDDDELFQLQLDLLKTTIQCQEWWNYELGCAAFWAIDRHIFWGYDPKTWCTNLRQEPFELLKRNKYCFIVAHNPKQYDCIKQVFPESLTVQLINDHELIAVGKRLKADPVSASRTTEPNPLIAHALKFDVSRIQHKEQFLTNVDRLLEHFDLPDKTFDPAVNAYYDKYIQLHFGLATNDEVTQ
jgi:hypothetical protein